MPARALRQSFAQRVIVRRRVQVAQTESVGHRNFARARGAAGGEKDRGKLLPGHRGRLLHPGSLVIPGGTASRPLEQFQEKCAAVFRPELRRNKEFERFVDFMKR